MPQHDDPTPGKVIWPRREDPISSEPPVLANSGAVDVRAVGSQQTAPAGVSSPARPRDEQGLNRDYGPVVFTHGAWECREGDYEDGDGFTTTEWTAHNRETGERRLMQLSRFHFTMTEARWRWLVENDFPRPPGKGPWSGSEIDARMEDGA